MTQTLSERAEAFAATYKLDMDGNGTMQAPSGLGRNMIVDAIERFHTTPDGTIVATGRAKSKLLAAASAASASATDIVEAARNGTIRDRDADEIVAVLVDAVRLVVEARSTIEAGEECILDGEADILIAKIRQAVEAAT